MKLTDIKNFTPEKTQCINLVDGSDNADYHLELELLNTVENVLYCFNVRFCAKRTKNQDGRYTCVDKFTIIKDVDETEMIHAAVKYIATRFGYFELLGMLRCNTCIIPYMNVTHLITNTNIIHITQI